MTSIPLSAAKLSANRLNAQFSSGPRTEQGKSRISGNAVSFGLFAIRDFVRADEHEDYHILRQSLLSDLHPEGVLELAHTGEILSATWRLLRCGLLEATLALPNEALPNPNDLTPEAMPQEIPDPMEDPKNVKLQASIDRARTQAWNMLRRATTELERLQARRASKPADSAPPVSTKQTHPDPQTPRNALCPCHSGQKFKRCCGRNAPPVLQAAARCSQMGSDFQVRRHHAKKPGFGIAPEPGF